MDHVASFLLCLHDNWLLAFGSFSHIVTLPSTATRVHMVAFIGSAVQTVFPLAFSLGECGRLHWQHCASLPGFLLICHERLVIEFLVNFNVSKDLLPFIQFFSHYVFLHI